ncbi:MAG: hypothetical protein HY343_02590 [Lentisphaerae bacterium]|nr:hypothetical protein [Lentisphaerota bacterium]
MNTKTIAAVIACLACCSCRTWEKPPAGFDAVTAGFHPRHRIEATTDENIRQFVDTHRGEQILSLDLMNRTCSVKGYSYLKNLRGLYALSFCGTCDAKTVRELRQDKEGHFLFPSILTDEVVREISHIRSLRALLIHYGSLSDGQKNLLRRELPDCKVVENLNKL